MEQEHDNGIYVNYSNELTKGLNLLLKKAIVEGQISVDSECEYLRDEIDILFSKIEQLYILYKVKLLNIDDFRKRFEDLDYLESSVPFDHPYLLYYLYEIGLGDNENFKEAYEKFIKDEQTRKGFIRCNSLCHTGPMAVLVKIESDSDETKSAINYFLNNYKDFGTDELAIGLMTLQEYDYYGLKSYIDEISEWLRNKFTEEGCVTSRYSDWNSIDDTAIAVQALCTLYGNKDSTVLSGLKWLRNMQKADGSWHTTYDRTTYSPLMALIAAGDADKVSVEEFNRQKMLYEQRMRSMQPEVLVTNPFEGDFSIKETIRNIIYSSRNRLWICSRFLTEFWTDIATVKKNNESIDIKIITTPNKDTKAYYGDGKKFLQASYETLQKTLTSNYKETTYLHARCVINDNSVLVSSADLSPEQLEKEFNMGIYTRDNKAVNQACAAFMGFWNSIS
jgi:hypothetical protein